MALERARPGSGDHAYLDGADGQEVAAGGSRHQEMQRQVARATGDPRTRMIENEGIELCVYDWGGDGPLLLLAHANGFAARMWDPLIRSLSGPWRVVAVDARGHGRSAKPDPAGGAYTWERFASDQLAALDALEIERTAAAGHSMGAAALVLAAATHPGRFSALFLFEPIIYRPGFEGAGSPNPLADGARRRRQIFESKEAARERLGRKPPFSFWAPPVFDAYLDHALEPDETAGAGALRLACPGEVEATIYENSALHGGFDALGLLEMPVTLVAGEYSPQDSPIATLPLAAALPNGDFAVMPGRTHFGPFEDPAAFAGMLEEALTVEGADSAAGGSAAGGSSQGRG